MPQAIVKNMPDLAEKSASGNAAACEELATGLLHAQARISPKYFYDSLGSKLFEAICQLDEYYLTRTEADIFSKYATEIAQTAGRNATLVDLGAGNCEKAARLFDVLQPKLYVPVDISVAFLHNAVENLRQKYPAIPMHPVGLDFSESLTFPASIPWEGKKLFFYPGSSLGNFSPLQAAQFLGRIRAVCGTNGGAVLLGVDLVKDTETLQTAYDDALGVTAAFNLNALRHINRRMGSDFEITGWKHVALFNASQSRIEMHLEARADVTVSWPEAERFFAKGERIHTESSYKFSKTSVVALLEQSGFEAPECWTDEGNNYLVCYARTR
jgi:dimethylhistidine N-methyltransferase